VHPPVLRRYSLLPFSTPRLPARTIDATLIAATQADLSARVDEGRFRADLYHRLVGEFQRVIGPCREGVQVAREGYDGFYELHTLSFLCLAHAALGQWDLAYTTLHEGMAKVHDWHDKYFLARLANSLGWFHSGLGDVVKALEHDRAGYELGLASQVTNTEISALINMGLDHLALGQLDEARRVLEATLERVEREAFGSPRWRWKIRRCIGLGRLWSLEHESAQAMRPLDVGLTLAVATGSQKYVAEGRGLRGEILATGGRVVEGVGEFRQALALGEAIACPSLTWRLAQTLGRAYERQGEMAQAHAMYEMAHSGVLAVAGRIADEWLRETLLASPQAASIRDDLLRLSRLES
jgi:tetratricopeptide (TPR) repeat protein